MPADKFPWKHEVFNELLLLIKYEKTTAKIAKETVQKKLFSIWNQHSFKLVKPNTVNTNLDRMLQAYKALCLRQSKCELTASQLTSASPALVRKHQSFLKAKEEFTSSLTRFST